MALGDLHERLAPAGPRSPFRAADRVGMARPNGRARFHGVMTMTNLRRVRRRNLSVTAIGLQVQRDRCALVTRWQDVTGVNRRRHQLLLPVEELRLSDSELLEPSSTGKPMRDCPPHCPETGRPDASTSGLYDKNWRTGPIGDQLRNQASPPFRS